MDLSEVVPFLGCSNSNPGLVEWLRSAGADIGTLSKKELRDTGMDGIDLKKIGLSLTFSSRDDYIDTYAEPTEAGDAILVGIFAYGAGGKTTKPYVGSSPSAAAPSPVGKMPCSSSASRITPNRTTAKSTGTTG